MVNFSIIFFLAFLQYKIYLSFNITLDTISGYSATFVSKILVNTKQEAIVVTDIDSFFLKPDLTNGLLDPSLTLMDDLSDTESKIYSISEDEYIIGCVAGNKIVHFSKESIIKSIPSQITIVDYCSLIKNTNNNHYYLLYGEYNNFISEEYELNSENQLSLVNSIDNVFPDVMLSYCDYVKLYDQICCFAFSSPPQFYLEYGQKSITFKDTISEAKLLYLYDDKLVILYLETTDPSIYYLETVQLTQNTDSSFEFITLNSLIFTSKNESFSLMEIAYINKGTVILTYFYSSALYIVKYYPRTGASYTQTVNLANAKLIAFPRIINFSTNLVGILFQNQSEIQLAQIQYPSCSDFEITITNSLEVSLDFNNYIDSYFTTLLILGFDTGLSFTNSIQENKTYVIFQFTAKGSYYSTFHIYFAYFINEITSDHNTNECIGTIIFTCNDEGELYKPLSYYTKKSADQSICVPTCDYNWFINSSGEFICTNSLTSCTSPLDSSEKLPYLYGTHCVEQCPSEAHLSYEISSDYSQCLSECPTDAPFIYNEQLCVSSCQDYNLISYNNKCEDECPNGDLYEIDVSSNSCKLNLDSVSIEDLAKSIDQSILELYKDVDIIKTDKYILGIYNTSKEDTELMKELSYQNGLSLIDLGSCEEILKKQYEIPEDEPLIIAKIELERENEKTNQLEYAVYSIKGEKLNLEYCNKANIVITSNIKNTEGIDIDLAIELSELGIDIYDSQDDFFNELCYSFTSDNNTDVILNDRQTDYFRNVSFCEDNCEYSGIDLTNKKVNCSCQAKTEILSTETVKTFAKQFKNTLSNSNFKVIKCAGKVFSIDIFTNNVGNYFMISMILFNVSCLLFYIIYGIDNLKKTMYLSLFGNVIGNPPNKSDLTNNIKMQTHSGHFSSTNFVIVMKPTIRKKITYNNIIEKNTSFTNSAELKSSHDLTDIHNDSSTFTQNPKYDKYEINYIKYDEAIKYDKRTKMSMFLSILVLKHPLIYAFFINDKYTIKSISISMFIISEQMSLAFNALFYTDGYISNQYKHEGNIDILASLPKSIYSSLFSIVLSIIFGFLTSSKSILMKILLFSDQKEKDNLNKVLRCIRIKLAFYFTLIFIFSLFFWYYVTAFCAVYKNSQIGWLIGAVISIALGLLTPVAMSLIVFIFRVIGIEKKSECSYKVSNFLL